VKAAIFKYSSIRKKEVGMKKKVLWLVLSCLMALSLVMAACGPAAVVEEEEEEKVVEEEEKVVEEEEEEEEVVEEEVVEDVGPKYGGKLILSATSDIVRWSPLAHTVASDIISLVNEEIWGGNWAEGPAGGYGPSTTDWAGNYNLWHLNKGVVAESVTWTVDQENDQGIIVYKIRQGIHYADNPYLEASKLLKGRELTADDVVFHLNRAISESTSYIHRANKELRVAEITKTSPWEVTVKIPLGSLITCIDRFGDSTQLVAPEIAEEYGGQIDWRTTVGSGPFILKEYVPGSNYVLDRNPDYWRKDPIGPGKGNQLPYLDRVQYIIIPDTSTRLAAIRTGKIDQLTSVPWDDAVLMRQTTPDLMEALGPGSGSTHIAMRVDTPPFDDIRVRRAVIMAIDYRAIHNSIADGKGDSLTRPSLRAQGYERIYVDINDPDVPESAKENLSYNPDRAKELLSEAGYPDGFKVPIMLQQIHVDWASVYAGYLSKVGIELEFQVKETGAFNTVVQKREHPAMVPGSGNPYAIFHTQPSFSGTSSVNRCMIDDPFVNETMQEVRLLAITEGLEPAMELTREITKRELELALEIPGVGGLTSRFWWPWIKNYAGETSVGYFNDYWQQFVWIDQDLKEDMGY